MFKQFVLLFIWGVATSLGVPLGNKNECFQLTADIVFAIDSSWSISDQAFQQQKAFLKALVDKFTIGENHIQVGVVSFASEIRLDIKLNQFQGYWDLKEAIEQIQQLPRGGTFTQGAISFVRSSMFEPENGGRPWARRQLVLVTDGLSNDTRATLLEASMARSQGVEIFSVLVGTGLSDDETAKVASEPKASHVFRVEDYGALAGIEASLSSATCQRPDTGSNPDKDGTGDLENETGCDKHMLDIVFLMDSSSSIWEPDFRTQTKFIQQVVSNFKLGPQATRVGVVAYSDFPLTLVSLSDKHDHIQQTLTKAPYITGGTDTALAIRHARKLFLHQEHPRPQATRVLIILTDGQSNNLDETNQEARLARYENVHIFSVGIGNKTEISELMALASSPSDQFVLYVSDFSKLADLVMLLPRRTCDVAESEVGRKGKYHAVCPQVPTDVVFVYDTSALTRFHHNYVIGVITKVTESDRLTSQDLRVGVVREAPHQSEATLHDIQLTNQWSQSQFKSQLDPHFPSAAVDTLLKKTRSSYFHASKQKEEVTRRRTTVLFLDSALKDPFRARIEATRLNWSHVQLIVVTLGAHTNQLEVQDLGSQSHHVNIIDVPNLLSVSQESLGTQLLDVICDSRPRPEES